MPSNPQAFLYNEALQEFWNLPIRKNTEGDSLAKAISQVISKLAEHKQFTLQPRQNIQQLRQQRGETSDEWRQRLSQTDIVDLNNIHSYNLPEFLYFLRAAPAVAPAFPMQPTAAQSFSMQPTYYGDLLEESEEEVEMEDFEEESDEGEESEEEEY